MYLRSGEASTFTFTFAGTNAMLKAMDVKIEGLKVVGNRKVGVGELVDRSSAPTRSLRRTK